MAFYISWTRRAASLKQTTSSSWNSCIPPTRSTRTTKSRNGKATTSSCAITPARCPMWSRGGWRKTGTPWASTCWKECRRLSYPSCLRCLPSRRLFLSEMRDQGLRLSRYISGYAICPFAFPPSSPPHLTPTHPDTLPLSAQTQMETLLQTLSITNCHYIRCIKPNAKKIPGWFDGELVQLQLKYAGMMETIRIRKMGYPVRHTFQHFYNRYRCLPRDKSGPRVSARSYGQSHLRYLPLPSLAPLFTISILVTQIRIREACAILLADFMGASLADNTKIQLGKTRMFMRDEEVHFPSSLAPINPKTNLPPPPHF